MPEDDRKGVEKSKNPSIEVFVDFLCKIIKNEKGKLGWYPHSPTTNQIGTWCVLEVFPFEIKLHLELVSSNLDAFS